jgi:Fe-S oxidoreductase
MMKQILFAIALMVTLGVFTFTVIRLLSIFRLLKPAFPVRNIGKRCFQVLKIAFGQTKILRKPVVGFMHALVWWGFILILIGSIEMVIDGLTGTERALSFLGVVYDWIIAAGDLFALIIAVLVVAFLVRRTCMTVDRFHGSEMKQHSYVDALIALGFILFLMVTLLGVNAFYVAYTHATGHSAEGIYPVGSRLAAWFSGWSASTLFFWHEMNWWAHILGIFFFANYLPYSKHFHVFLSVPNVFLSDLSPLGKIHTMESVTREVTLMLDPEGDLTSLPDTEEVSRFGIKDVQDINWKNYLDSLSCTQCGRCTSVCPAHHTGKKLSPRKIVMNVRERMKEKSPGLLKEGLTYDDGKALSGDYITPEELWACTTCNACVRECPLNINPLALIMDMRRYLVMEESAAPGELNQVFANIENNGAPWQFAQDDRMKWAEKLFLKQTNREIKVPVVADLFEQGKKPEYLFWVGSAGAFDDRYKQVVRAFVKILDYLKIDYAVLGTEESSSGDVARRAGNEMLFQMQALQNIELLKHYEINKIITCDPHVYNTFRNEYPDFGSTCEVFHHTQFLKQMMEEGKLLLDSTAFKGKKATYHDPCYLGRINGEYQAPRKLLEALVSERQEMPRNKSFALCCGAGGGQMFKEAEKGDKEIFIERTEEALETGADLIVTACPYCMVMMTDGLKYKNKEEKVKNYDIAELIMMSLNL